MAMGKACVAIKDLPLALYYNPANISADKMSISLDYQNFFGIRNLNQVNLVLNVPFHPSPFACGISSYGNNLYREFQLITAGAYQLAPEFSIGVSIQYYHCSIKGYGSQATWGINLGAAYQLTHHVFIGSQITNLNQPTISHDLEKLPQTFSLGMTYKAAEVLLLNIEFFRDTRFEQEYRFGLEYRLAPYFNIRTGIIDQVNNFSAGCALSLDVIAFEYALVTHQVLGVSHVTSLLITL